MVRKGIIVAGQGALLPLANRPLVAHVLDAVAEAGVTDTAVLARPDVGRAVEQATAGVPSGSAVRLIEHQPGVDLADTIADLSAFLRDEPFLLHLGDSLSRDGLGPLVRSRPAPLDAIALVGERAPQHGVVDLAARLAAVDAATDDDSCGPPVGAWVLGAGVPEALTEIAGSGNWELDVAAATRILDARGGHVSRRPVAEWWRHQGRPGAVLEGNRFVLESLRGVAVEAELIDTRIQGVVSIDRSARLESSVVRGPAIIGARVRLRDAYIGPYTAVGDDVVVEGAEIEHSVILPGASIRHLGGRLEASVVGPKARVFRDFRLPKAVRLNVGEGAEVSLA